MLEKVVFWTGTNSGIKLANLSTQWKTASPEAPCKVWALGMGEWAHATSEENMEG